MNKTKLFTGIIWGITSALAAYLCVKQGVEISALQAVGEWAATAIAQAGFLGVAAVSSGVLAGIKVSDAIQNEM